MNEIQLKYENDQIVVSSLVVAKNFGKEHKHVLESIRNLAVENSAAKSMFFETTYENRGKQYPMYLMNRDGFSLLAMSFTGKLALSWKLKYIDAFNRMERELNSPEKIMARALLLANNEINELKNTIEEQKPMVEFANKVGNTNDLIDMNQMAKILKDKNVDIGRNRLFEYLRKEKILMKNNQPYQKYIDSGYFSVRELTFDTNHDTHVYTKTFVTGKGQIYIAEKVRENYFK